MKLSAEVLDEGRALIRASDLDGYMAWVGKHAPLMTPKFVRDTYEKIFKYGDTEKGLRLFEHVFPNYDPGAEMRIVFIRLGMKLLTFLGLVGGVVYLVRSCTGH